MESLIQVDPDQPIGDEEARIILETKLALKLLDFSRSLDSEIRANITMPLEMTEIEQLSPVMERSWNSWGTRKSAQPTTSIS